MRNAFVQEMVSLAQSHHELVMLSGDMGNRLFNPFQKLFPDRFYNCGVAEANMASLAAGMALCGLRPVTYSIAPFNTFRCFEQIKIDICYHRLPVIIVGVGAGLSYAELGATHQSCEDISVMRSLPEMTVVCPGDAVEVRLALRGAVESDGPVYLRLGKKNEPIVHETAPDFKIGKGIELKRGKEVCLLSTGTMLPTAVKATEIMKTQGRDAGVVSMHTVKPLDKELLTSLFSRYSLVASVEEHSLIGGLGSAIAEWKNDLLPGTYGRLLRFGYTDAFFSSCAKREEMYQIEGVDMSAENIASNCLKSLSHIEER